MDSGIATDEVTNRRRDVRWLRDPSWQVIDHRRTSLFGTTQPLAARVVHVRHPRGLQDLPLERGRRAEDYEFQIITVPRNSSVAQVRAALTEQAEYGRWEHARTRLYMDGGKKVWLRRRIIRVESTLGQSPTL